MTQHVPTDWLVDSGAIHHINNDLDNLHITNSYHGQDQLIVGDSIAFPIAHTSNTILHTHSHSLRHLSNQPRHLKRHPWLSLQHQVTILLLLSHSLLLQMLLMLTLRIPIHREITPWSLVLKIIFSSPRGP